MHSSSAVLAVSADLGKEKCPCIGFEGVQGETKALITSGGKDTVVPYPAELGSSCNDWDDGRHPFCRGDAASGFCKDKWCYVNPKDCNIPVLPKQSLYMPSATFQTLPVFYSYATCGAKDTYAQEVSAVGLDGCRCVGFAGSPGMTKAHNGDKTVEYPAEVGGLCKAWDSGHNPECVGESQPDWCEKKWCIVDPCSCTGVVAPKVSGYFGSGTFQNKPIFFSYATCGGEDLYSVEGDLEKSEAKIDEVCKDEKSTDTATHGNRECPCIGFDDIEGDTVVNVTHAGASTQVSYPADLGGTCDKWEANSHPTCKGESPAAWCKSSWCYVDPRECSLPILPKKSDYQPTATYQAMPLYYSYSTCGSKDTWSTDAPDVGMQGCRCIGIDGMPGSVPVMIDGTDVDYPAEMGGQCKAWDEVNHPKCKGNDKADWCMKKWCYVDPCSCHAAAPPKTATFFADATFQGRKVFWSYATCGETDTYSTKEHQTESKAKVKELCSTKPVAPVEKQSDFNKAVYGTHETAEKKSDAHEHGKKNSDADKHAEKKSDAHAPTETKSGAQGLTLVVTVTALCASVFSS